MATFLDKLKNKVQIHHLSYGEKIAKIGFTTTW